MAEGAVLAGRSRILGCV